MRFPAGNRGFGNDPLLGVGIVAMAFALVLTLVAVVLTMLLRNVPEQAAASETDTTTKSSVRSLVRGESSIRPWREKARPLPAPEVSKDEANLGSPGGEPKPVGNEQS